MQKDRLSRAKRASKHKTEDYLYSVVWSDDDEAFIGRVLEFLPFQRMHHSRFNTVRIASMPMIVKAPDDQSMLFDEGALRGEDGIAFSFGEIGCFIQMVKEGRLMRDDEVIAGFDRALQHVEGRHHGNCDSGNRRVGISSLESIHSFAMPGNSNVGLNPLNHLP